MLFLLDQRYISNENARAVVATVMEFSLFSVNKLFAMKQIGL